ncbi:hypothetical protein MAR_021052, partial [Mya arenaria]
VANTDVGSSIKILTDSSQTVECTSSGNPSPATSDFTWRMGTSEMSTGSVLNWQGGIKVGDEDSYTCTVETTLTPSDQSKDAKVATNPPELPTLHWDSSSGPVIDGPLTLVVQRLFTLACVASSKPPANYTWTGGVNVVHGQLLQDTLTAKVNTTRTCTARNILNPTVGAARAMSSSATITLNINYPPESVSIRHESVSGTVIQSEFRVIEGNSTKLYCTVQSQPASSFRWSGADIHSLDPPKLHTITRRNALEGNIVLIQCLFTAGNPITTRSTFTRAVDGTSWSGDSHTFQSIHREDAGLYRCTVENSMDPTGAEIQTGNDTADFEINAHPDLQNIRVTLDGISLDSYMEIQVPDNPGFAAAVTYEARTATQETSEYDALNAENDRPDKSHVYMSVVDSTSTPSPHYENSKTEDPVYNNTMLQNSVQTVL